MWLKWPISFYSGKDLYTEGEFQLLLYSTRAALPTMPIDGCHEGLTLHHPLKLCHSCNSGEKCNFQNNKSSFTLLVRSGNPSYAPVACLGGLAQRIEKSYSCSSRNTTVTCRYPDWSQTCSTLSGLGVRTWLI